MSEYIFTDTVPVSSDMYCLQFFDLIFVRYLNLKQKKKTAQQKT